MITAGGPSIVARFTSLLLQLAAFCCVASFASAVTPTTSLTSDQLASRFLAQATFGPSPDSIAALAALNNDFSAWIDLEAAKPVSSAVALLQAARVTTPTLTYDRGTNRRARNELMLAGSDQLRHRVAYALSQIMVISDLDSNISDALEGSSSYYDMLARNALGSFRTLLIDVTRHPMMGRYLSHYKNRKANLTTGTRPDENYAREILQLFSIGLYDLNLDGSVKTDTAGRPIESYTNDQITEFARVFTGFTDESTNNTGTGTGRTDFPNASSNYTAPMRMWDLQHDTAAKTLLNYPGVRRLTLPANQTGLQDVNDAIDNIVEHPNTAPFISRLLIQRLVTSNPSPAYIGRVAAIFVNNGSGVRGDLLAVVKAILLDDEARNTSFIAGVNTGKLREPFLRTSHFLRAFRFTVVAGTLPYDLNFINEATIGQYPMSSPSVFNFYSPDYEPPGPIGNAGLVGPEFQILNSVFAVNTPNIFYAISQTGTVGQLRLDFADQIALGANPAALVDNLNLLLCHGTMSTETRTAILTALQGVTPTIAGGINNVNATRARLAIYLTTLSPDFAVLK